MAGSKTSLSARFAFQSQLSSQGGTPRWLAIEAGTGRRVVIAAVNAGRLTSLNAARGVQHRHLAGMIEIISGFEAADLPASVVVAPGSVIAVAEYVPGRTLERQLTAAPLSPEKAVAWTLRLVEAVQALHQKGAVHGAISPWSVIAEPEGRAIAPALAQLLAPPVGAYCPPEKLKGSSDSPSDDVWALYATLYTAVAGKPPFLATERDALRKQMMAGRPKPLAEFGLDEPALSEIVIRGLVGERRLRVSELSELGEALDGWQRDPKAMPARRPPAPRPTTTRGVADLLATPNTSDDGIVFDGSSLTVASPPSPAPVAPHTAAVNAPPRLPVAPAPAIHAPPALPVVVSAPPPLPVVSAPPPLPAVSAPPPLPVVSAPPPLPAVSAPPPLPVVQSAPPVLSTAVKGPVTAPALPPALPPLPPEPARVSAAHASLENLVAQLPQAATAPFPAVVAPVHPPAPRRLSFNPFEKKRRLWPIAAGAAAIGGLGVYLALGAAGAPSTTAPAATPKAPAAPPKPRVPEKPKVSSAETRATCIRSYFPERAFATGIDLSSVCDDGDFREASKRLFTTVRQQPLAAHPASEGGTAVANASLGWYELPAAAIIRKSCCTGASAVVLPETVGWCEQLQSAVRRIADDSDKAGDVAPGARAFDKAVTCLYVHRINRPYTYERPPSEPQRREFQRFLSLAAISEARR